MSARSLRRTVGLSLTLVLVHLVCAYVLDAAGFVESLLSPSGIQLMWILPLTVVFYAIRLATYFLVPGLLIGCGILWVLDHVRSRAS